MINLELLPLPRKMTLNYIFAVLGIMCFGANDPEHFRSIARAMASVWHCEMLDSWEQALYINMFGCERYGCELYLKTEIALV